MRAPAARRAAHPAASRAAWSSKTGRGRAYLRICLRLLVCRAIVNRGQGVARLHLVGRDAVFLALELLDRERLQETILVVGYDRQTIVQRVDTVAHIGHARSVLAVVARDALSRLLHLQR